MAANAGFKRMRLERGERREFMINYKDDIGMINYKDGI